MDAVPVPVQILCRQCSAPLPVEQGSQYVKCEFCGATNVVEKGRTVFHYAVKVTVRRDAAEKALRRCVEDAAVPVFVGGLASVLSYDVITRAGAEALGNEIGNGLRRLAEVGPENGRARVRQDD